MTHNVKMMRLKRLARGAAAGLAVALSAPLQALAQAPSPLQPASPNAARTAQLFWVTFGIAAVVFVVVEVLLIYAVVRYRRKFPDDIPEQVHGNTRLEVVWTIIPALILVSLFGLTLNNLRLERRAPADAMVVEVTGRQWFWEFNYPETEITVSSREGDLIIPAEEPVAFEIRSADVIHSFWVPELAGKMDAIPGHTNTVWFEADEGTYAGQCAEYCGLSHYDMLFDVVAVPREEFDAWIGDQIAQAAEFQPIGTDLESPLPEGDAAHGEQLFEELGCNSCHSLDGTTLVGPSMEGIGERAAERRPELDAVAYLRESILLPCDYLVEGFTCVMPQNYGERLEAQDLADVIAYLLEQ